MKALHHCAKNLCESFLLERLAPANPDLESPIPLLCYAFVDSPIRAPVQFLEMLFLKNET